MGCVAFAELTAMRVADAAFTAALESAYGKRAGDVRYQPRKQTAEIRALGDAFAAAAKAWHDAYSKGEKQ
jgi:hypothetical protein